jgi:hypothetical protein
MLLTNYSLSAKYIYVNIDNDVKDLKMMQEWK